VTCGLLGNVQYQGPGSLDWGVPVRKRDHGERVDDFSRGNSFGISERKALARDGTRVHMSPQRADDSSLTACEIEGRFLEMQCEQTVKDVPHDIYRESGIHIQNEWGVGYS
jgi:hypothetical protein